MPTFRAGKEILELKILDEKEDGTSSLAPRLGNDKLETSRFTRSTSPIKELGFTQTSKDDLFYSREDQKVFRNVRVFVLT